MSFQIDFEKLFHESPMPRLVVSQEKKDHFFVTVANNAAIKYFCPHKDGGCATIDGMYLKDFLDSANTTHILQALSVCFDTRVPITIQVLPKHAGQMQLQSFLLKPIISKETNDLLWIDMIAMPEIGEVPAIERERNDAISMFTTVFDVSDVGITVVDHHGRFVRINKAFIEQTGWQAIDLLGEELIKIIPKYAHDMAWERHKLALQEKRKNFGEVVILKKDGSEMNVMVTSVMMELSNGRTFRITTIVDVTELKEIEKNLRKAKEDADEANKAKSAFLANMSHELRTPLNAIIGFSEMMINGTLGPVDNPHYLDYLGDIKFSAHHLLQIINDVLDMSKIEAGKMPLDDEEIHVKGLLESVRRLMIARAEDNNIRLELICPDTMPYLMGDERLIRQVFLNILSNAVKFSKPHGVVTIKISYDDVIKVDIIDHGIGIPLERINEVFEPFGQISDPRVNKGQGTGLGLPIAKAMMDMHGGDLIISSEKDKGTTVTCIFPSSRVKN